MYMYIYIQKFISYEFVIKKNTILYNYGYYLQHNLIWN